MRQLLWIGTHRRSISSKASQSVLIARFSTEVKATSNMYASRRRMRPASRASITPFSLSPTSVHPVNRFSLFQVLSPCLNNTSFFTLHPLSDLRDQTSDLRLRLHTLGVQV